MEKLLNIEGYYWRSKKFFQRRRSSLKRLHQSRLLSTMLIAVFAILFVSPTPGQSANPQVPANTSEISALAKDLLSLGSQAQQDLLTARKDLVNAALLDLLREQSNALVQKGSYADALKVSQLAVIVAEQLGDRLALANSLIDLGSVYGRNNRWMDALHANERSLTIFEESGDQRGRARSLHAIGFSLNGQRLFERALESYQKSVSLSEETGDSALLALSLNSMGLAHTSLGHNELGLELYQKSRALAEKIGDKSTLSLALNNIATHYISQGRYAEALDCLQRSLKIGAEMGAAGDRRSFAYRLQNVGLIYRRQGRMEQALAYARKSLEILEEIGDKFGTANLQNNIGVIYKSLALYAEAHEWLQKSLRNYEESRSRAGIARSLNNIGDNYRLQGRYAEATESLQRSLRLREEGGDRGEIALTLNNLGRLYNMQGKYADVLSVSSRAAALAEEINAPEELWNAQDQMGRAFAALGKQTEARKAFFAAIATIESLRIRVAGGEQQQQSFLENRLSPWLGIIDLLVSQQNYAEALSFAEQSKARVLLDALQAGRTSLRKSLSASERKAEEDIRLQLVFLNSQLTTELRREKSNATRIAELRAELEKARLAYEDFETKLYVAHPELKVHRGEAPTITTEELTGLVPDARSALVEFVVGDARTYLFVVSRTAVKSAADVRVYTLAITRRELAAQIEGFRQQLANRDLGFRVSAARLYTLLLGPAEAQLQGKTTLVIAPDDTLWDLPFQALINRSNRFLIEDAAISHAPSLTVLREMTRRTARSGPSSLLAFGNPTITQGALDRAALTMREGQLAPLPAAEQEVQALKQLYGTSRSRVYVGGEAREDRVKVDAAQADVIHFATHGTLNNASPMYSHLALAEGGPNEDGLLEAWELMQLDLKANLAVLSACETARGRVGAGEGMIGLSWALFIAGVPSLVVSQWKVESASTRDLMVNFHRSLIASATSTKSPAKKVQSLRQAALKLMKSPQTSHPFYWAGFVLVGDSR